MLPCPVRDPSWRPSRAAITPAPTPSPKTPTVWQLTATLTPDWWIDDGTHPPGIKGASGRFSATLAVTAAGLLNWKLTYRDLCKPVVDILIQIGRAPRLLLLGDDSDPSPCAGSISGEYRILPFQHVGLIDELTGGKTLLSVFVDRVDRAGAIRGAISATMR